MIDRAYRLMQRFILLVPLVCTIFATLGIWSCASSKNTQTETSTDYKEEIKGMMSRMDSLNSNMSMIRKETTDKLSNIKLENRTTYLSVPDSTGKQYPTVISETKSEQKDEEHSTIDTQMQATLERLEKKVCSLSDSISVIKNEKQKVVQVSWWDRYKSDLTMTAMCMIIIWLVYKKRNK